MSYKSILRTAALILIFLFWVASTQAQEFYFVTLEYPPLEYKDKTGSAKGVAVEIVTRIMSELGHTVSIEVLPWERALMMVKYGRADAIFTIFKSSERELFLDYSEEILIPQMVALYALKDSPINFDGTFENLKQFKIGVVSTISYGRKFDRSRSVLKVERTSALEQNFRKLMLGRIDLVISNVYSAEIVINNLNLADKVKRLYPSVESVPSYIAFSKVKKLGSLREAFDLKLFELKKNGKYIYMLNKSKLKIDVGHFEKRCNQ